MTETQSVWIEPSSQSRGSPKGAKTDWFLLVPACYGGGDVAVTVGSGHADLSDRLTLELRGESGSRIAPQLVATQDGQTVRVWSAPEDTQLWRLLVKGRIGDGVGASTSLAIAQHVAEVEGGERVVFVVRGALYKSKLCRVVEHGSSTDSVVVRGDSCVEYSPTDPRDHLATRFLPLARGVYQVRLRFSPDADITNLSVRPQLRDSSWLPTSVPTLAESDEELELMFAFEVPHDGVYVRLHFKASRPMRLPDVELARLTRVSTITPAPAMSVAQVSVAKTPIEHSIRELAALADEPRLAVLLGSLSEETVREALAGDPWLLNYTMNAWEFVHRRSVLTTYPPDVCIPIADVCNARCTFCTSWLEGTAIASIEQIEGFEHILRFARWVGLAGHGEPLAHPHIREILARLTEWLDPRADGYLITNGVYLEGLLDELTESRIRSFAVSLNAATPATHVEVMGLPAGSFEKIITSIERIVARRDTHGSRVSVSMVVTRQNVAEVPAFIQLANNLGVVKVQLKTLAPTVGPVPGLNYHTLPPYDHPDYVALKANAVAAIAASGVPVQVDSDSWDVPVFSPTVSERLREQTIPLVTREEALKSRPLREVYRGLPKYQSSTTGRLIDEVLDFDGVNPFGRVPPFACRAPYRHLYINDFSFNLSPCCYLPKVPGAEPVMYDGSGAFLDAWNSEALVALRRRLSEGPLFNTCTKCPGTY